MDNIVPHWVDEDKYRLYLKSLSERDNIIVKTIVKNTTYISSNKLIEMIGTLLDKLPDKYNIFVPTGKIGSEHWILLQLLPKLRSHVVQFIYGYDDPVTNDFPIVILDDAIYSSTNMCSHIDMYTDTQKNLKGGRYKPNKFYCVVGVTSSCTALQVVTQYKANIITSSNMESKWVNNLIDGYDYEYMYEHFECESESVLPLLFEHKIANAFGSYQFYHKIVKTPPNRSMIDCLTFGYIEECINKK